MSGYWVVEVETGDDGKTWFATQPYSDEQARFDSEEEAGDYADEILSWYERKGISPQVGVAYVSGKFGE
jgi:hypothetical protein